MRALAVLLLVLGGSGCATTDLPGDPDGPCETVLAALVFGAVAVPCMAAFGAGCVVGAGERCCEGPTPESSDIPRAAPEEDEAPAAAEEGATDVAY